MIAVWPATAWGHAAVRMVPWQTKAATRRRLRLVYVTCRGQHPSRQTGWLVLCGVAGNAGARVRGLGTVLTAPAEVCLLVNYRREDARAVARARRTRLVRVRQQLRGHLRVESQLDPAGPHALECLCCMAMRFKSGRGSHAQAKRAQPARWVSHLWMAIPRRRVLCEVDGLERHADALLDHAAVVQRQLRRPLEAIDARPVAPSVTLEEALAADWKLVGAVDESGAKAWRNRRRKTPLRRTRAKERPIARRARHVRRAVARHRCGSRVHRTSSNCRAGRTRCYCGRDGHRHAHRAHHAHHARWARRTRRARRARRACR
eukprot:6093481-Prymnesium_polylepis.1